MNRRDARKNALTLLFQLDFHDTGEEGIVIERFFSERPEISGDSLVFIKELVMGTKNNIEKIDSFLDKYSKGWSVSRMSKIDRSILRLSVYELKIQKKTPSGVVINEAVELAKEYSSDEAPSFINGILGKILREA